MTPPAPRPRDLAGTLIRHAAGLTCDTAAAELIAAHHTWLARTDFITSHIHAGTRHDGHPLRLDRLGIRRHRPRRPPAQLHRLRGRHPAHRRQSRPPRHPRPPRPRAGLPRPHQHRPGHHGHHPRERLTATTWPPPRQPGHHKAPPNPPAGPFPSPDMPSQSVAVMPIQNDAGHTGGGCQVPPGYMAGRSGSPARPAGRCRAGLADDAVRHLLAVCGYRVPGG